MLKYVQTTLRGARLQPIKVADFGGIIKTDPAFFLYLQNYDTTLNELVRPAGARAALTTETDRKGAELAREPGAGVH